MAQSMLSQIEGYFDGLSIAEQLLLIERLVHQAQKKTLKQAELDKQLVMMAADPEIQNELHAIEREFATAEGDGLENN